MPAPSSARFHQGEVSLSAFVLLERTTQSSTRGSGDEVPGSDAVRDGLYPTGQGPGIILP
jgi:hypothetical protein